MITLKTPQAMHGTQHTIEYTNIHIFLFRTANTRPRHEIIMGASRIPIDDTRQADNAHAKRIIHSPLFFFSDIALKEKYRVAGSTTFAKTALPCQIRNSRKVELVYTETFPNTLRMHRNNRNRS